jgi:hypothetical protein
MDAEVIQRLSYKEQTLFNRARIFLQVECLSDITDSSGKQIQKAWLRHQGQKPSHSIKRWPKQEFPGKEAWSIWKKYLMLAYTDDNLNLRQPLGPWYRINDRRIHNAYWEESKEYLITMTSSGTPVWYKMLKQDRRHCYFSRIPLEKPYIPATRTPISILNVNANYQITTKPAKLQLKDSSSDYTLNGKIRRGMTGTQIENIVPESTTGKLLRKYKLIDAASDGSHDPTNGKMAFGWTVAIGETIIATGKGPAEGDPTLASAFRAEAYGLQSVAKFLRILIDHFNVSPTNYKWFIHIDNKALIARMDLYKTWRITPKSTQWPDADVTISAYNLLVDIDVQFQHIKSHSTKENSKSFPSRIHNIADELAKDFRGTMKAPQHHVTNNFCLLRVNDRFVTRDMQRIILETASEIPISQFLQDKYEWKTGTFELVNWELQYKTLSFYTIPDQQRILKFVHNWLPTNHRLQREAQSTSARCPLCHYRIEDNLHLFQCTHPRQVAATQTLTKKLSEDDPKDPVTDLITLALSSAMQDPSWIPPGAHAMAEIKQGIKDQNKIGWQQIVRGRFAKTLTQNGQRNKDKKLRRNLRLIWDTMLTLWKQRNEEVHQQVYEDRATRNKRKLEAKLNRCYLYRDRMPIKDRDRIFTKEKEAILQDDEKNIKTWIKMAERMIRVTKREEKQHKHEAAIMEQYFKWHPPDSKHSRSHTRTGSGSTIQVG